MISPSFTLNILHVGLEIRSVGELNWPWKRDNQQILWNLRIKVKRGLNEVLFFPFAHEYRMVSYLITICLLCWASVSSLRILKITQADGDCSVNNLGPNECCQFDDSRRQSTTYLHLHLQWTHEKQGEINSKDHQKGCWHFGVRSLRLHSFQF